MNIGNLDKLTYIIEEDELNLTYRFTDPNTTLEVGFLTIAKVNSRAFIETLQAINREVRGPFSEFDDNNTARTSLQSLAGTIEFNV